MFVCMFVYVYMNMCICMYGALWLSLNGLLFSLFVFVCLCVCVCVCVCHYYNDQDGLTALMRAAKNGHVDVVRYWVEQGANKDLQDGVRTGMDMYVYIYVFVYVGINECFFV